MGDLLQRLNSFTNWPPEFASFSPVVLANAGFMYTGYRDKVTCPVCGIEIDGWQSRRLSDPKIEHRMRSPGCSLVGRSSPSSEINLPTPSQASYLHKLTNTHSPMVSVVFTSSTSVNNDISNSSTGSVNSKPYTDQSPVIGASNRADETLLKKQPTKAQVDRNLPDLNRLKVERSRLETYSNWPATAPVNPSELAKTGLFYTGVNDRVRCVFCGGILHNWTTDDVPASEHHRHFPDCPFIKGLDVGNVPLENKQNVSTTQANAVHKMANGQSKGSNSNTTATATGGYPPSAGERNEASASFSNKSINANGIATDRNVELQNKDRQPSPAALNHAGADSDEEQRLLAENRQLIEARTCKVCMDKMVDTVFLPCGHLVACQECAPKLKDCPVCRTYIRGTVKSFFS